MLATKIIAGMMIWSFVAVIGGLALGRIIARADRCLSHHDGENSSDRDGASGQFHNGDIA